MHRLLKVFICSLIACALCACASVNDSGSRIAQPPAAPTQAEAKAVCQNPSKDGSCVVSPGSAATPANSPTASTGGAPIAEVPETAYSFAASVKSNFSHTFIVKNVGTSDLKIKKVLPG